MERILITGVAGFIGSNIAKKFITEGYEVIGIDDLSSGNKNNIPKDVVFIEGDLAESDLLNNRLPNCKKILHLAGQSSGEISFDDPVNDLRKNVISTLNLINYGIKNKSDHIIYASSMSVYGNVKDSPVKETQIPFPLSCYGVGKLASENYLNIYKNKLPYTSFRMFNVYGPGQDLDNLRQGMVSIYVSQAIKNKKIIIKGSTERFRDFIYIDDVVEAWWRAANTDTVINQIINIGTGSKTYVKELISNIREILIEDNIDIFIDGSTPGDQNGIYSDNNKLDELLKINSFIDLQSGLKKFIEWAKKY